MPVPLPATLHRQMRHLVGRGKTKKYCKCQRAAGTTQVAGKMAEESESSRKMRGGGVGEENRKSS